MRISEERYRIALQSAEMGAWDWDLVSNKVVSNPQNFRMYGLEPHDGPMDATEYSQYVHPEDIDTVRGLFRKSADELGTYNAEFRVIRADNQQVRWMSTYGKVVAHHDG